MKYLKHRDQVHRDVFYDPLSVALMDTPQMQRLGRIYQLGFTHLVYRGGTHTRLSHVMGAASVAEDLVVALRKNYEMSSDENCLPIGAILPEEFLPKINMAKDLATIEDRWDILLHLVKWGALLHDIGHVPLGHTLEDEFSGIYVKHDSFDSPRMPFLWDEISPGKNSPIKEIFFNKSLYPKSFHKLGFKPIDVWQTVMLICLYKEKHTEIGENVTESSFVDMYCDALKNQYGSLFHQYMADIVADTICADYIDYLQRDTLNVGLDPVREDRIIQSYFIGRDLESKRFRMALSLKDKGRKPKLSICTAAKNMVRHRFDLAEIIYYHKTKVAASAMLAKVFALIEKPKETSTPRVRININDIETYVKDVLEKNIDVEILKQDYMPDSLLDSMIGDETLLMWMFEKAWSKAKTAKIEKNEKKLKAAFLAISLLEGIVERRLYKVAVSINADLVGKLAGTIQQTAAIEKKVDGIITKYRKGEQGSKERYDLENLMSDEAGWPHGSFIAYVPGRKGQAKGIETGALDDNGEVITLGDHSTVEKDVSILNDAYKNLWRFLMYVHPDYKSNIIELSNAVDCLLKEIFPTIDFRKSASAIKEACWFDYIPKHNREAARIYSELNNNDPKLLNWTIFNEANTTSSGTIDSEEHAYRAKLSETLGIEKVKNNFSSPGLLHKAIQREMEPIMSSESKKGKPGIEDILTSLERIDIKINNPKSDNLDLNGKLFD